MFDSRDGAYQHRKRWVPSKCILNFRICQRNIKTSDVGQQCKYSDGIFKALFFRPDHQSGGEGAVTALRICLRALQPCKKAQLRLVFLHCVELAQYHSYLLTFYAIHVFSFLCFFYHPKASFFCYYSYIKMCLWWLVLHWIFIYSLDLFNALQKGTVRNRNPRRWEKKGAILNYVPLPSESVILKISGALFH